MKGRAAEAKYTFTEHQILDSAYGAPPSAQFNTLVVADAPADSAEPLSDIIPDAFNPAPVSGIIHLSVVH